MKVGVNYPWVTCGHDFGPRPPPWAGAPSTDWDAVRRDFEGLRAIGVHYARWWVLGGGVNLPCGIDPAEIARRKRFGPGFPAGAEQWVLDEPLPTLPTSFLDDFERLLEVAETTGVRLWPSLLSFEAFLPLEEQAGGVTSGGRGAMVLDASFYDTVLEPLLDVCARRPNGIFAFEVMNEPGWALEADWLQTRFGGHPPWIDSAAMSAFLVEGVERIAQREVCASVGFLDGAVPWLALAARTRLRAWANRGLYVHQHHHYPSVTGQRTLPPAWRMAVQPCWLGEVSTSRHGRWDDPGLAEDDPATFLTRRLARIEQQGFAGALLWARRATDPHVDWNEGTEAQVRAAGYKDEA